MIPLELFWVCLVSGRGSANICHTTYEGACQEAERLAKQSDNIGRSVYVLEGIAVCQANLTIEWGETEWTEKRKPDNLQVRII